MSKALVIKGANFTANKIETITLTEVIPCAGISITPTTVAFDTLGATQQITATVTPADTTDTVYYVSSNTDMITVSASGLITCVGVGSATVTVTCGTQSAVCTVTSEVTVNADDIIVLHGKSLSTNSDRDYLSISDSASRCMYAVTSAIPGAYKAFNSSDSSLDSCYGIEIPSNTTKITVNIKSNQQYGSGQSNVVFLNSLEHNTYNSGIYSAKRVTDILSLTGQVINNEYVYEIDLTNSSFDGIEYNAFVTATRFKDSTAASGAPTPVITFS